MKKRDVRTFSKNSLLFQYTLINIYILHTFSQFTCNYITTPAMEQDYSGVCKLIPNALNNYDMSKF